MKETPVEVEGTIHTILPGTIFRVLATVSSKLRKRWVRLTAGDRVKMEMFPYELGQARIVWGLE